MKPSGRILDDLSDQVDEVHVLQARSRKQDSSPPETVDEDGSAFRQYQTASERVRDFYAEQHAKQTVAFNLAARARFRSAARARPEMTVWEAMEKLDSMVDDSDPDTELSQLMHLVQTAEAMRRDGKPRWMQAAGLVHDVGKLLHFYGAQGQWDVVGDTFPVGCRFDRRIVFPDSFDANPDSKDPVYSSALGIYEEGCGLENVILSWGHDEYLYHVLKDQSRLPPEALAMIRFHSFYAWHTEGAYRHLMAEEDHKLLAAVQSFNPYDLYSKSDEVPDVEKLKVRNAACSYVWRSDLC